MNIIILLGCYEHKFKCEKVNTVHGILSFTIIYFCVYWVITQLPFIQVEKLKRNICEMICGNII